MPISRGIKKSQRKKTQHGDGPKKHEMSSGYAKYSKTNQDEVNVQAKKQQDLFESLADEV